VRKLVWITLLKVAALWAAFDAQASDSCGSGRYFNGHRCRTIVKEDHGQERHGQPRRRFPSEREPSAQDVVKGELGDPGATFGAIRQQAGAVCGTVEAKNPEGVSSGQMLFVYVRSERKAYVLDPRSDADAKAVNAAIAIYRDYCQR
jgi:hypothetical protein